MFQKVGSRLRTAARVGIGPQRLALRVRQARFRWMSTTTSAHAGASITGAVLATGEGSIAADGAMLGYWPSPDALTGCVYLEARHISSVIAIGQGSQVNNGSVLISEGPGIFIGERVLIGPRVTILDSDFHPVSAAARATERPQMGAVRIGDDVFIGASAIILRGVTVGDGAVIGAGAVVAGDVGPGEIVAGSPARLIGNVGTNLTTVDKPLSDR